MRFLALFLSLGHWIDLILHILKELNDVHGLAIVPPMMDHSKMTKIPFWMIKIAKNKLFCHFHEFGASDWLDFAYSNRTIWFACFGQCISYAWSFKNKKLPHKIAKNKLLACFLQYGWSDWLEIAYYHRNEQCAGLANIVFDLLNSPDCPFWMIQIAKNEFLGLIELNSVHD